VFLPEIVSHSITMNFARALFWFFFYGFPRQLAEEIG
jgi:hypothetical protein